MQLAKNNKMESCIPGLSIVESGNSVLAVFGIITDATAMAAETDDEINIVVDTHLFNEHRSLFVLVEESFRGRVTFSHHD
jgi:hypothetical protein